MRFASLISFVSLSACGGLSTRDLSPGGGGTAAGSGGGSAAGRGGTSGAAVVTNSSGIDGLGCRGIPVTSVEHDHAARAACGVSNVACALAAADLHLVVERSNRMLETIDGVSKWELVQRAVEQLFMPAPSAGFSLRVFGVNGVAGNADACDPTTYSEPIVPAGKGRAALESIRQALGALRPDGLAPAVPALAGALKEIERVQRDTRDAQRVVLILGGAPSDCAGTPDALRATFAGSNVTSYVIALDPDFDVAPVAEATETWPFVISSGHSETRLADALRHIASGASRRACDFGHALPSGPIPVLLDRTRAFFGNDEIPRLANAAECATSTNGGFYVADEGSNLEYRSCPCTCAAYTTCAGAEWLFYCE